MINTDNETQIPNRQNNLRNQPEQKQKSTIKTQLLLCLDNIFHYIMCCPEGRYLSMCGINLRLRRH